MIDFKKHGFSPALIKPYRAQEMSRIFHELLGQ